MPSNIEGSRLRYGYDKAKGTDRSCLTVWKNQECLFLLWDNQADAFVELIQSAEERGMRNGADRVWVAVCQARGYRIGRGLPDEGLPLVEAAREAFRSLIPKE